MGNISFIYASKNKDQFNKDSIIELLNTKFDNIQIETDFTWNGIKLYTRDGVINELYFDCGCYLLDGNELDKSIKELDVNGQNELSKDLSDLKETNIDMNSFIQKTHCNKFDLRDIERDIEKFIHSYFGAYIFDGGIHPEFISPKYVWKREKEIFKFSK